MYVCYMLYIRYAVCYALITLNYDAWSLYLNLVFYFTLYVQCDSWEIILL
jgi:hypothetical protein